MFCRKSIECAQGTEIDWRKLGAGFYPYHIETEAHDIVLAEGAPSETYVDYVGRSYFDNHADYAARNVEERPIVEMTAPRVTKARQLPATIRDALAGTVDVRVAA